MENTFDNAPESANLFGAMLEEMAYEQGMTPEELEDMAAEMLA